MNFTFKIAETEKEFENAKNLFKEYAASLNVDLCFQDFSGELVNINKQYNKPDGALLICYSNQKAIACVAIRKSENGIAELKRMFVKKEYRGNGIGEKLLTQIISIAKEFNYKKIRLDTLPAMISAQKLYRSFGFVDITAYRFNPVEGTVYMEKELS